ncbi:Transcriptional regulatory protein AfsQ1 [Sphingomonas paucimobilis]|nr:Transcriptional regulatory protein AfsQ1 [Sphingomonas paucimobilis]
MEGARILYIDDDDALRRLVARALARRGWAVTGAASGAEGVALAAEGGFDLVAVDHYMPGMDGLETLTAINALREPPPVVYVTGSDEGRIAVAALKAGAADYVVKAVGEDFFDCSPPASNRCSTAPGWSVPRPRPRRSCARPTPGWRRC